MLQMIFRCLESSCLRCFPSSVFDCFCCIECTNCVSTSNSSLDSSGGTTCSLVSETSPLLDTLDTTWRTGSTRREEQMRRHHNFWNAHMLFHSLIHLTLRVCIPMAFLLYSSTLLVLWEKNKKEHQIFLVERRHFLLLVVPQGPTQF